MREKLEHGSLADFPEHEQLEVLLFSVIPRGNTNEIAHELLRRFGSIYGVLSADTNSLIQVEGVGERVADFLHNLPAVLGVVMRSKVLYETDNRFVLKDTDRLKEYLLIKYELICEGSIDEVYLDIKMAVRRALMNHAAYVVLTHNHPSGLVFPSDSDIISTRELSEALNTVKIGFWDHVIVGGNQYYSFRESRNY